MLEAFRELCVSLCYSVSLYVPLVSDSFVLECDASGSGIGAALSVERDGDRLPVAFFSRQLHGAQARYSAQELEGLALFESVKHFAYFLYGRKFVAITDHRGLVNLRAGKQENRRLYNWSLKLTEFDFDVVYRPGSLNVVPDTLSRCYGECGETPISKEGGDVGFHLKQAHTQAESEQSQAESEPEEGEGEGRWRKSKKEEGI